MSISEHKVLRHQALCLPRNLRVEIHQMLRGAKSRFINQVLRLPQSALRNSSNAISIIFEILNILCLPRNHSQNEGHRILYLSNEIRQCIATKSTNKPTIYSKNIVHYPYHEIKIPRQLLSYPKNTTNNNPHM